jgi:hypothetical protein
MTRTRLLFAVSLATLVAFALPSSNGTAIGSPVSISALAPADEYFGRAHYSPLAIRHTIFTLKNDLHRGRRRPDAIAHDADLVQDALEDWAARFPRDTWLPSTFWNLAVLYEELPGAQARTDAIAVLRRLTTDFGQSQYAAIASKDLSRGIGIRPWPHWAGSPPPQPTTAPASSPTSSPASAPTSTIAPKDPDLLVRAILAIAATPREKQNAAALALEDRFFMASAGGTDPTYARAAWELASTFERLPGEGARTEAIRLLALLVDRYPNVVYGKWALRDLKRGVGERS